MNDTQFVDEPRLIVANRASSYGAKKEGGFERILYGSGRAGPGNLHTTPGDLARWDRNFYEKKVGGPKLIERMLHKGKLQGGKEIAYAGGLIVRSYRGLHIVEHGGSVAGYRSVLLRFPEQRFSVVVLANLATMKPAVLARKVADVCLAKELGPVPPLPKGLTARPELLDAAQGEYRLDSGLMVNVLRVGSTLSVKSELGSFTLRYKEKDRFEGSDGDNRVILRSGTMKLETSLGTQEGRKLIRPVLTPKQLTEFTGMFHSEAAGRAALGDNPRRRAGPAPSQG